MSNGQHEQVVADGGYATFELVGVHETAQRRADAAEHKGVHLHAIGMHARQTCGALVGADDEHGFAKLGVALDQLGEDVAFGFKAKAQRRHVQ